MSYFFTTLLQSLLPTALLLACAWSAFNKINIKALIWTSLIAIAVGISIASMLSFNQITLLSLNSTASIVLVLFLFSQCRPIKWLNNIWHFLLCTLAAMQWAKNPNINAITATDVINTDFILHLSAVIFGLLFCLFLAAWLYILLKQVKTEQKLTALRWSLLLILSAILLSPLFGDILLGLMKLQVIELTKTRLSLVAKTGNIINYINYISAGLGLLIISLYAIKFLFPRKKAIQLSENPIEKRQKTAKYIQSRRIVMWGLFSFLFILMSQLYWDKFASQPLQLSEATPVKLDQNQQVRIPIEQVKDGNLHRFVWVADDGKAVRFFIINRLEDRLSLGVVFDACLLCGDQGYVMQDGQVVCVGCEVRMFKPSIGKPGGCNPVPIENWQQTENEVIIDRTSLEMGLNLFSTVLEIEVIDPVDQTKLINTKTEFKYNFNNKTYFFANEKNLELFRDKPENYVKEE
ncbi:Fe-S-containing protein [Pasteurellaceae bacterium 22721_9_1]